MVYGFMTLHDKTDVSHTEMREDGTVKVYFEKPIHLGFDSAECTIPEYKWDKIEGFSEEDIKRLDEYLHSVAHIIIELSQNGGFANAANF